VLIDYFLKVFDFAIKLTDMIINAFTRLSKMDKLLSLFSFVYGFFLIIDSAYFIWAYNFSSILFFIMIPMIILISELVIGLFLTISGFLLINDKESFIILYEMTGILMILSSVNHFCLFKFEYFIGPYVTLPFGFFLCALMNRKKSKYIVERKKGFGIVKIIIGIIIFIMIDFIFYSWDYLDRVL
jgi:hypothetical protein